MTRNRGKTNVQITQFHCKINLTANGIEVSKDLYETQVSRWSVCLHWNVILPEDLVVVLWLSEISSVSKRQSFIALLLAGRKHFCEIKFDHLMPLFLVRYQFLTRFLELFNHNFKCEFL